MLVLLEDGAKKFWGRPLAEYGKIKKPDGGVQMCRTHLRERKLLRNSGREHKRDDHKRELIEANTQAKRAVAQAMAGGYQKMYEEMETKEGQKKMHRLARARNKATKDITNVKQIKDTDGRVLSKTEDIQKRWKGYFERLLNEENDRLYWDDGQPIEVCGGGCFSKFWF